MVYPTVNIFNRFCLPSIIPELKNTMTAAVYDNLNLLSKWFADIKTTSEIILAVFGIALVVGYYNFNYLYNYISIRFIYLLILRWSVGILTWAAILLYFILLGILCWLFYKKGVE